MTFDVDAETTEKPNEGGNGRDPSTGCFAPGTLILMANGTSENIENIKVNDFVMAYDETIQ